MLTIVKTIWVIILLFPILMQAQDAFPDYNKIIQGVSNYRTDLMSKHDLYKSSIDPLKSEIEQMPLERWMKNALYYSVLLFDPTSPIAFSILKKNLRKNGIETTIFDFLKNPDTSSMIVNKDIKELINENFPEVKFPFKIKSDLEFYEIKPRERIAEIKARKDTTSLVLGVVFDSVDIFINEIHDH